MADVGQSADDAAPASVDMQTTPLQTLSTASISQDGYFAWAGPALCDEDENAYFLIVPHLRDGEDRATAASGALNPRDVLRVSADGKKRITFSPGKSSTFANATELTTIAVAVDRNGTLFMLIWARWREDIGQPEKSGQYIVSFDQKGECQSHLEVDWQEILVSQFEVFGSGEFLLRGRRTHPAESRVAILSASGQTLKDVGSWSGKPLDEPSPESAAAKFDQMARGRDGRIYLTQGDPGQDGDVVYAISASGQSERVFKLPPLPKEPQLVGWKAADDRFAATYRAEASSGERTGRWWIAVYSNVTDGPEPETTLYGPAPGPPICYQHKRSRDRFTFLTGAQLVTMSSP
jgi:hypothetical protein